MTVMHTPTNADDVDYELSLDTTRELLGLNVAATSRRSAALFLEQRIRKGYPARVAFVNANLANMACEDEELMIALRGFVLLNDGAGLNIASRFIYGEPFPDNLNGTDFIPYFLDTCGLPLRIFLLGAHPSTAQKAAHVVTQRWPRHVVAGHHHGFIGAEGESAIVDLIREARADLVLVAMGNGLQERWIGRLVPDAACSAYGVGALFDFLSGEVVRAPTWMRRGGLEWIFRLGREPRRLWRRYLLGNLKFLMRVLLARHSRTHVERKG